MKRLVLLGCILLTSISFAGTQLDIPIGSTVEAKLNTDGGVEYWVNPLVGGIEIQLGATHIGGDTPDGVWAGCYLIDIEGIADNYKSFCLDLTRFAGFEYTTHTAYEVTTDLEAMWGTYYDSVVDSAVEAAAFQLAVWEIVHETGSYDISSGHFYFDSLDTSSPNNNGATFDELVSLANGYLDSNSWSACARLAKLDDGTNQPYLVEIFPEVYLDIKPGSCPNPINLKQKGVLPAAILGTKYFDVDLIDPTSIRLSKEGVDGEVAPIRWNYEDVGTPFEGELCDCWARNGDGTVDLTVKFETEEVVSLLELHDNTGETIALTVTAVLYDGTVITAQDCVRIIFKDNLNRRKRIPRNKQIGEEKRINKKSR